MSSVEPNRQCQICQGYELDDGTSDVCDCDDLTECLNPDCFETVYMGGYCSMSCKRNHEGGADE